MDEYLLTSPDTPLLPSRTVCLHVIGNLETMHDSYLPTLLMSTLPIICKRTRTRHVWQGRSDFCTMLCRLCHCVFDHQAGKMWLADALAKLPCLAKCKYSDLLHTAMRMQAVTYTRGEVVVQQGTFPQQLLFLVSGAWHVTASVPAPTGAFTYIIGNARIKNVGEYQSCMVSKLRIIWKQTLAPVEL